MGCEGYTVVSFCELWLVLPKEALSWDIMSSVFSSCDIEIYIVRLVSAVHWQAGGKSEACMLRHRSATHGGKWGFS